MVLKKVMALVMFLFLSSVSFVTVADELVKQIQQDLNALGYDAGTADGQVGVKTQMAIGKFQQTYGLAVDGKPSVSVAIAISEAKAATQPQAVTQTQAVTPTTVAPTVAAQEGCLQQKAEQAQLAQSKTSMFGAITDMAGSVLSSFGQYELVSMLSQAKTVAQQADTIAQLSKDLGITEQQVADCLATAQ